MQMFRAVISDMDGTLYDTERISHEGWVRACRELHCDVSREDLLSFRGRPRPVNAERFRSMKGNNGISYSSLREIHDRYFNEYLDQHGVPLKKGLFELFQALRDHGILIGIATGTDRATAESHWRKTGLLPYVEFSVCGMEGGRGKPEPDCYLNAVRRANEAILRRDPGARKLLPAECVVLEDAETGVLSAKAAGCAPIVIPDLTPPTERMREAAYAVVPDLIEAGKVIFRANASAD
jgi:HAD superfamily hydrolase (TIGR01509 family)